MANEFWSGGECNITTDNDMVKNCKKIEKNKSNE